MKPKLLSIFINKYVKEFEHLKADENSKTLFISSILKSLEDSLQNKPTNHNELISQLKGNQSLFTPITFESTKITSEYLPIFLTLNLCLYTLTTSCFDDASQTTHALIHTLSTYRKQALISGLKAYKESCLLISDQITAKQNLLAIFNLLSSKVREDIDAYRKHQLQQLLDLQDKQHNLNQYVDQRVIDHGKNIAVNNLSHLVTDQFSFVEELEVLLQQPQLSYRDIYKLKESSEQFALEIHKLPSVNQVDEYHWIINFFINLVNKFVQIMESTKSQQLKQICTHWQTNWIDVAKVRVDIIEARINIR